MSEPSKENNVGQGAPARIKELRINGPMTANIVGLISSVSRIESRVINMSMAQSPSVRDKANSISERYQRALRMFEDELRSLNKDAEADSRPANRRDPRQAGAPVKAAAKTNGQAQQATTGGPGGTEPKNKKARSKNRRKGQDAQRPAAQAAAPASAPAPAPAPAPVAADGAEPAAAGKATSSTPAGAKPGAKPRASAARSEEPANPAPVAEVQKGQASPVPAPAI